MKTIVYSGGHWGPNIGNAFFNLGITHAFKEALPESNFVFLGDPPGWWWRFGRCPGKKNILFDDLKCEYLIISGPLFCSWLKPIWFDTLEKLKANGTKILFISAGSMEYTDKERQQCLPLLKKIKPYLLITRDSETYQRYGEFAEYSHDGICFAFFCREYLKESLEIQSKDIALCFDKGHDFDVLEVYGKEISSFLKARQWPAENGLRKMRRSRKASHRSEFDHYRIVRPYHVTNTRLRTKLKQYVLGCGPANKPNSYLTDVPTGYLYLYQHAVMTISERVHACVAAISFGNHAWLTPQTGRARLFSRVGLDEITERPVRVDLDKLKSEKDTMISFLREKLK